jgi:hypothetical protein
VEQHNRPTHQEVRATQLWGIFEGGALSGIVAGLGALLAAMIHTRTMSGDWFLFPKIIASGIFGFDSAMTSTRAVFVGIVMHFAVAVVFGIIFAAVHPWESFRQGKPIGDRAVAAGVLYATILWGIMTFAVLPWSNPSLNSYVKGNPYSWYGYHLIYGTLLLASPLLRRRYAVKHSPNSEGPSNNEKIRAA